MNEHVQDLYDTIDQLEEKRLAALPEEKQEIDKEIVGVWERIQSLIGQPVAVEPPHR